MLSAIAASKYNKRNIGPTYDAIIRDVRTGSIAPVYLLMGEESYYIDHLADFIVEKLLQPDERDFNLITLFGADADADAVINAARGFPVGSEHLVVVVKEAQRLSKLERLDFYMQKIQPSSVLILCYKEGVMDRRTKLFNHINKLGIVFESKKLYDSQLIPFISAYLHRHKIGIVPEATGMLVEYVGSDLNRMAGELDKLCLALQGKTGDAAVVTPDLVATNVGISKDFNIFELQDALGEKKVLRVMQIADYFAKNQKANSLQKTLPMLFKYFANVMQAYYAPDKSEHGIAMWLGMADWQARRNVLPAMRHYTATKVMHILTELRRTDARSKGINNPATPSQELMRELFYFILH